MRVCLISSIRDGGHLVPAFRAMVERWTIQPSPIVIAYNDCIDHTAAQLRRWPGIMTLGFETGVPKFDRVATRERSRYLALCYNRAVEAALAFDWDFAYLTSCEKWTARAVVERLLAHRVDIVAPLVMVAGQFYDTWCFKCLDGTRLLPATQPAQAVQLQPMLAVGGTYLVRRAVFEAGCRYGETDGAWCETTVLCAAARARGFSVFMDRGCATRVVRQPEHLQDHERQCDQLGLLLTMPVDEE